MAWIKKNREPVSLPALHLSVQTEQETRIYTPNSFVIAAFDGELRELPPVPTKRSLLSSNAALVYRTEDVAVALTPDELHRLAQHNLTPDEYFRLREHYGIAFDWHEDFYDYETGEALQPAC